MEIITKSAQETANLGKKLADNLKSSSDLLKGKGVVVALYGDLGSGKTTFTQGLARGLGITKRILSPTFIMMRQYAVDEGFLSSFSHVDLYRIEGEKEAEGLGLGEIWSEKGNIMVIEWPEKIKKILPEERIEIFFENIDENRRKINTSGF